MYGKVFASMFTGSMMGAGGHVHSTMIYAISNADERGCVELNPELLAVVIGEPLPRIQEAIAYLEMSDPRSRTPGEEGRRLVREGQFLYRIVNYGKYRDIRDKEGRRQYQREWDQKNRPSGHKRPKKPQSDTVRHGPTNPTKAEAEAEATPPIVPLGGTVFSQKKKKLFPIPGKNCKCGMPAIYKTNDAYPKHFCGEHMPDEVKELYE